MEIVGIAHSHGPVSSSLRLEMQRKCTSVQNVFLQTEHRFPPYRIGDPRAPQFKIPRQKWPVET